MVILLTNKPDIKADEIFSVGRNKTLSVSY